MKPRAHERLRDGGKRPVTLFQVFQRLGAEEPPAPRMSARPVCQAEVVERTKGTGPTLRNSRLIASK